MGSRETVRNRGNLDIYTYVYPIMMVTEDLEINISILEQGDNVYICNAWKEEQLKGKY